MPLKQILTLRAPFHHGELKSFLLQKPCALPPHKAGSGHLPAMLKDSRLFLMLLQNGGGSSASTELFAAALSFFLSNFSGFEEIYQGDNAAAGQRLCKSPSCMCGKKMLCLWDLNR